MQYYVWYDDNPKLALMDKLQAGITAYTERFSMSPNLILVNAADQVAINNMTIRSVRTVPPNTFWIGFEDSAEKVTG